MDILFRAVDPVQPAAGYIGGKRNLARRIIERISAVPHNAYAEPFVGMGGVFLRRPHAPRFEAINDVSGDVATFFRVLQRHYVPFVEMLRWQVSSRREFERLAATDPATLTDLERSARFLYLQRLAFGGKVVGQNFGVSTHYGASFNVTKLVPVLEAIHERLAGVVVEQLGWESFLDRYDRPGMLFYLDPPYHRTEHVYGKGAFERSDFAAIAERLAGLKGRFILSINDHPEIRQTFSDFDIDRVETTYTVAKGDGLKAGELIVSSKGR